LQELKDIKVKYFNHREGVQGTGLADEPYERGMW